MAKTGGPLLLIVVLVSALLVHDSAAIGVNYGTLGNNLPPPAQVAAFLKERTIIDKIKLFDTNPDILNAFANTGIAVTVTVFNGDIPSLVNLPAAQAWVAAHISPFHPRTIINRIAVGNEILHWGDAAQVSNLLPAMRTIHTALKLAGINDIQVSTPHSLAILVPTETPSTGSFRPDIAQSVIAPMLQFHRETRSPFMVNPYPYFGFNEQTLNYAMFKPNRGIYDRFSRRTYSNRFDALLDTVYMAMKKLGYGDIDIVAAETGWPSMADANQLGVSVESAKSYIGGLVRHVNSGVGTPLMPRRKIETYIFALFNENQKPGPTAERNFGLFQPDFTPVYDAGIMRGAGGQGAQPQLRLQPGHRGPRGPRRGGHHPRGGHHRQGPRRNPVAPVAVAGKKWCVPKAGASDAVLQSNIDYVCSLGANCKPIQVGGNCFNPNNVRAHASYAMNTYYQAHGRLDSSCDFRSSGVITTSNPSYGSCAYLS